MVTRTRLPWLLALPLIAAGSLAAHSLGYVVARPDVERQAREAQEAGGTYLPQLPPLAGLLLALAIALIASRVVSAARGTRTGGASPWWFFLLPPLGFALQELLERVVHAESFPFQAAFEPAFLAGLLLQLPFGLIAFLVARALLAVARRILGTLVGRFRSRALGLPPDGPPPLAVSLPRIAALALGRSGRGPPLSAL